MKAGFEVLIKKSDAEQLIRSANDAWQVVDWAHRLHQAIPGSELHVIEDCGHVAMEDQPEKVAALLIEFLRR